MVGPTHRLRMIIKRLDGSNWDTAKHGDVDTFLREELGRVHLMMHTLKVPYLIEWYRDGTPSGLHSFVHPTDEMPKAAWNVIHAVLDHIPYATPWKVRGADLVLRDDLPPLTSQPTSPAPPVLTGGVEPPATVKRKTRRRKP